MGISPRSPPLRLDRSYAALFIGGLKPGGQESLSPSAAFVSIKFETVFSARTIEIVVL